MAKYSDGSLTLIGGSDLIYGSDVAFIDNHVVAGDKVVIWGLQTSFTVIDVLNNWTLQLDKSIPGKNTVSGAAYVISDDFTPILSMPLISNNSVNTAAQMRRALEILDLELPTVLHSPPDGSI
jgi:hypothetical protein